VLLDQAFAVLSDPQQRYAYDKQRGYVGDPEKDRKGISNREVTFLVGGILAAMVLLATLWATLGNRPSGPAVTEVNYPAPPFVLRTLDGKPFDLSAYRGKVVLINFWATWCEPCKEETPALQAAHQRLADEGLVIVGVDLFSDEQVQNKNEAAVAQFTNQYGVTYPIALDESGQVARDYHLYPIPVSYFIDRSGNVRYIRIGQLTTAAVEELFRRL
jgi:cytochrome c biogenesis protein CcmG/thiol:disulfide interchange protein DsbE